MKRTCQSGFRAVAAAALAAAMLGAQAPAAFSQSTNNQSDVVLNQGTIIPVTLDKELTSNGVHAGDTFTVTVDTSKSAYKQLLDGATIDGVVRNVTPKQGKNAGTLDVAFTRLRLGSGSSYAIDGSPTSLNPKNVTVRSDGVLQAKNTSKDEHLTYAGIGAGAAALVSILANGNLKVKDALLDSVLGGLLGYGAASILKGPTEVHDVDLKPGTEMGVLLNQDVTYSNTGRSRGYGNSRQGEPGYSGGSQQGQPGYYSTSERGQDGAPQGQYGAQTHRYPAPHVANGKRYYWLNGREWIQDLATGAAHPVYTQASTRSALR